jgi:hypothetical protein
MPKQKGDKHRFMDKCRVIARDLISKYGANAVDCNALHAFRKRAAS